MHKPAPLFPAAPRLSRRGLLLAAAGSMAAGCGGDPDPPPAPNLPLLPRPPVVPVNGPAWSGFAGNAQHTALGQVRTQQMDGFYWYTPVDLAPELSNGALLTHYGSPVITPRNTVLVPVRVGPGTFRVQARVGATGDLMWQLTSDYLPPPHRWIPSFNPVLTPDPDARMVMPVRGGRVQVREGLEDTRPDVTTVAFYGNALYNANPGLFDNSVFINTPLTSDSNGNVYFGFTVVNLVPGGPAVGGVVRIAANGTAIFVSADAVTGDARMVKTAMNAAPALSNDEGTLYVVFNSTSVGGLRPVGRLVALDATTLAFRSQRLLTDPATGDPAWVSDDATSSPLVGPDGNVYLGVLESNAPGHNYRGWLLNFNAALSQVRTPGSFGWDNTPSIVPRAMLGSLYSGSSSYLLLTKYNNYAGAGTGDGRNRIAILDPNDLTQPDPIAGAGVTVMREVITQLGPTPDANGPPGSVREWCVNTAAVDPATNSVLINSEDGNLYRWDLPTNRLSDSLSMNAGVFQSYTPTAIGPDGRIYAINNAYLHCVGQL